MVCRERKIAQPHSERNIFARMDSTTANMHPQLRWETCCTHILGRSILQFEVMLSCCSLRKKQAFPIASLSNRWRAAIMEMHSSAGIGGNATRLAVEEAQLRNLLRVVVADLETIVVEAQRVVAEQNTRLQVRHLH